MIQRILFVCLGNICRSPTAEGVMAHTIAKHQLQARFQVDSAGTAQWHKGEPPDKRTLAVAKTRGYDLSPLRARPVLPQDFDQFDYILAMDKQNLKDLQALKPSHFTGHLGLFLAFHPKGSPQEMPDPYYSDEQGFIDVLNLTEAACEGLLQHLLQKA